jgi:deazaflavin-dependent oxidoreductase (nitroreductase family)
MYDGCMRNYQDTAASADEIRRALTRGGIIDITTTGRRSGRPRRIEIALLVIDGRHYISGMPSRRTRAWIHNLSADPRLTVHLKRGVVADLPARARVVTDPDERERILPRVARIWNRTDIDRMLAWSPLIEVTFDDVTSDKDTSDEDAVT